MSSSKSDFEAAQAVLLVIEDFEKDRQQRILRWVAESLGFDPMNAGGSSFAGQHSAPAFAQEKQSDIAAETSQPRSIDIKSFVESKSPKSDIQYATVVAYYYRFESRSEDRSDSISADLLQNSARLVGRNRLANPLMTLNNAKKQGYLDSAERGAFHVNTVGENLVAMTLPGGGTNSAPTTSRKQAKGKKTKSVPAKKVRKK